MSEPQAAPPSRSGVLRVVLILAVAAVLLFGCLIFSLGAVVAIAIWRTRPNLEPAAESLVEARRNWETTLVRAGPSPQPGDTAIDGVELLNFESDGRLLFGAFAKPSGDGPHPAVVFCHGGFAMGGEDVANANRFLQAGYAIFVPAWRGENGNQGNFELFYGEVNDAVAAMEFVASLPGVDPDQVYLMGHSAGGTTALLAAETSQRPRAVVACGPMPCLEIVANLMTEPPFPEIPYDWSNKTESALRSPAKFVRDLSCPAQLVFGADEGLMMSHADLMKKLADKEGKQVTVSMIPGADHFTALDAAITEAIDLFNSIRGQSAPPLAVPLRYPKGKATPDSLWREWFASAPQAESPPTPEDQIPQWTSQPDRGAAPIDWSGFAREYFDRPLSIFAFRFYAGNGRWVTSSEFEESFVIAGLDGKRRHEIKGRFPNLFNTAYQSEFQAAGVSLDARLFAVQWSVKQNESDQTWRRLHTFHDSSDGSLRHTAEGYTDCQFIEGSRVLMWRDAWLRRNPERGRTEMAVLDLDSGAIGPLIAVDAKAALAVSPGAKHLILLTGNDDGAALEVRDIATSRIVSQGSYPQAPVGDNAAVSDDGRELATYAQGQLTVWDLATGKVAWRVRASPTHHHVSWLDGRRFLLLDHHVVLDRENESVLCTLAHRTPYDEGSRNVFGNQGSWLWQIVNVNQIQLRRFPLERIRELQAGAAVSEAPPRVKVVIDRWEEWAGPQDVSETVRQLIVAALDERLDAEVVEEGPCDAVLYVHYKIETSSAQAQQWTILGEPVPPGAAPAGFMNDATEEVLLDLSLQVFSPQTAPAASHELAQQRLVAEVDRLVRGGAWERPRDGEAYWTSSIEVRGGLPVVEIGRPRTELTSAIAYVLAQALRRLELPAPDRLRLGSPARNGIELTRADPSSSPVQRAATTAALDLKIVPSKNEKATSFQFQPYLFRATFERPEGLVQALVFVEENDGVKLLASLSEGAIARFNAQGERDLLNDPAQSAGAVLQFTTSADHRRWAGTWRDGIVIGSDDGAARWLPGHGAQRIRLSHDGSELFGVQDDPTPGVVRWDVQQLLRPRGPFPKLVAEARGFSDMLRVPDSNHLIAHGRSILWRIDPASLDPVWKLTPKEIYSPRLSADGKQLSYTTFDGGAKVITVDAATGREIESRPNQGATAPRIYTSDGARYAASLEKGRLGVYRADDELQVQLVVGDRPDDNHYISTDNCLAWSRDGRYLAAVIRNSSRRPERSELAVWDFTPPQEP